MATKLNPPSIFNANKPQPLARDGLELALREFVNLAAKNPDTAKASCNVIAGKSPYRVVSIPIPAGWCGVCWADTPVVSGGCLYCGSQHQ